MTTVGGASVQDDEWFGEGSAFDSGEDLAAALFALAGTARIDAIWVHDGLLAEHWDVIQDEATAEESQSGLPMFGDTFPTSA